MGTHKDKNVIWVRFPNDTVMRNELKQRFPSVSFSWTNKCWYLADTKKLESVLVWMQKLCCGEHSNGRYF
jgi:hypothetical protein